ncbi:MAG: pilus assembly PilX N-terminal domain-containing protein [bacterium]|nr:pilus assembly PilX N-terminal domain-containing protein [bacterium]MDT8365598.1 pilus assembly PilX N-terminal domain-containing protein [bacterium]
MNTIQINHGHEASRGQRGTALVLSLFLITVLTVLGTMVLNTAIVEIKMAQNQKISSQVFYAAEAGLERGLLMLIEDFDTEGGSAWGNANYVGWAETVTESAVSGSTTFDPDVRSLDMYISSPDANLKKLTLSGGHGVNNLTFDLYIYKVGSSEAYVMSNAYGNGGMAAIEYHLAVEDMSPYNNAIFTGAGVSGHFQGSVNLAGSIYSRGTLDVGANVQVTNNYTTGHHPLAPGDALYDMLPAVTDLDTKVRVKGGDLNIESTSAQIGYAGTDNRIEGIYVDGATNIDAVGTHYYDEHTSEVPDVPLPSIYDGIREIFDDNSLNLDTCIAAKSGANDAAIATSIYADWVSGTGCASSLSSSGMVINASDFGSPAVIDGSTGNLTYDDGAGNGMYFDDATDTLTIKGNVVILGDLKFGQSNGNDDITYEVYGDNSGGFSQADGGTLYCSGDLEIRGGFSPDPSKGYLKGVTGVDDINSLGVVTPGDITFTGKNDNIHAGFYFAEGQVNFNKQSKFAGTIIGGLVNFSQVPDVYQVPNLKNYLPPGVPGGQTIVKLTSREWRRVY